LTPLSEQSDNLLAFLGTKLDVGQDSPTEMLRHVSEEQDLTSSSGATSKTAQLTSKKVTVTD